MHKGQLRVLASDSFRAVQLGMPCGHEAISPRQHQAGSCRCGN